MKLRSDTLRKKKDIEQLARTGKKLVSVFFIVKHLPNKISHSRWVVVVSTKTHKTAVKRNRIRRQIKEIIRDIIQQENVSRDVMVVVKANAIGREFALLKRNLAALYKEIRKDRI